MSCPLVAHLEQMAESLTLDVPALELKKCDDENAIANVVCKWNKQAKPTALQIISSLQHHAPQYNIHEVIDFLRRKEGATEFHVQLLLCCEKKTDITELSDAALLVLDDILKDLKFPEAARDTHFNSLLVAKLAFAVNLTPILNDAQLHQLFSALAREIPKNEEHLYLKQTLILLPYLKKKFAVDFLIQCPPLFQQLECDIRNDSDFPGRDILHDVIHSDRYPAEKRESFKKFYLEKDTPLHCLFIFLGLSENVKITVLSHYFDTIEQHPDVTSQALVDLLKCTWYNDLYLIRSPGVKQTYLAKVQKQFESLSNGILKDPPRLWDIKIKSAVVLKAQSSQQAKVAQPKNSSKN